MYVCIVPTLLIGAVDVQRPYTNPQKNGVAWEVSEWVRGHTMAATAATTRPFLWVSEPEREIYKERKREREKKRERESECAVYMPFRLSSFNLFTIRLSNIHSNQQQSMATIEYIHTPTHSLCNQNIFKQSLIIVIIIHRGCSKK